MFDTIADMLRGSAPDDLAHALGTDRTQTRRAMEIGLPALITGLRDKTLEPGGALNLASMLDEPGASVPENLDGYLAAGDPAQGAAMLDVAFGDRGEPALAALSSASGLSTRLLAQVMSVLAPLATGVVGAHAERTQDGLRSYLAAAVEDLDGKGFGRVVELVSPGLPADAGSVDVVDAIVPEPISNDFDVDDGFGDNVVEGAFPDLDDAVSLDESVDLHTDLSVPEDIDLGVGDATESFDFADEMPDFGGEMSAFDADVTAATELDPLEDLRDAEIPVAAASTPAMDAIKDAEVEGKAMSGMGWLWWLIAAVLGLALLLLAVNRCGSDDGNVADPGVTTTGTETTVAEPTPDPLVAQRQATLDQILVDYPNVSGEVIGEVAVLDGTVANETERALLDQAVRAQGLGAQNNVVASAAPADAGADGYSLNDLIDVQPELSTLRTLLDQAGLGEALNGGTGFTLFAPTNDAFAAIADDLAALQDDPAALQEVLRYHLLVGAQDGATIAATPSLATQLEGQNIAVDASSGAIVLNGNVQVLAADAVANNGVMHIVSGVLLPSSAASLPDEIGAELGLAAITFAPSSSTLTDAGKVELDKVVAFLQANPGNIEIGGHTDSDGGEDLNLGLSQDRADAVKTYLAEQGIPADSMTAVGFGETSPIAENDTAENKALNRRIEFRPS